MCVCVCVCVHDSMSMLHVHFHCWSDEESSRPALACRSAIRRVFVWVLAWPHHVCVCVCS